jgi:DNA-binding MarR family transcriptional regulator
LLICAENQQFATHRDRRSHLIEVTDEGQALIAQVPSSLAASSTRTAFIREQGHRVEVRPSYAEFNLFLARILYIQTLAGRKNERHH